MPSNLYHSCHWSYTVCLHSWVSAAPFIGTPKEHSQKKWCHSQAIAAAISTPGLHCRNPMPNKHAQDFQPMLPIVHQIFLKATTNVISDVISFMFGTPHTTSPLGIVICGQHTKGIKHVNQPIPKQTHYSILYLLAVITPYPLLTSNDAFLANMLLIQHHTKYNANSSCKSCLATWHPFLILIQWFEPASITSLLAYPRNTVKRNGATAKP